MTLDEIIEGCKNNNQKAYNILYDNYKIKLLNVIKKYVNDIDTAKDILQQIFIKVYHKIKTYTVNNSFEGWLILITKNTCIDYLRRYKNNMELIDNIHLTFNPYEEKQIEVDNTIKIRLIKECINYLTPVYKEVFNLYVIEGYEHKEIGMKLGINEGTSKSNLFKAKNNIRKLLNTKLEFN